MEWEVGETWAASHATKVLYAGGPFLSVEQFALEMIPLRASPEEWS